MPHSLTSLFMTLMTAEEITVALQQRIFTHGRKRNDVALLARLASHPSLDASIDAQLKEESAALVRCAWISRPGRNLEDITDVITKEKRVTVLSALAEQPMLSEQVARTLVERTKNTKVLLTLVKSPTLDDDIKKSAADRIVASLDGVGSHSIDTKQVDVLCTIASSIEGYLEQVVIDAPNLVVLRAAVTHCPLDADSQRLLVNMFLETYAQQLSYQPTSRFDNGSVAQVDLCNIIEAMCETSQLDDGVRKTLEKAVKSVKTHYSADNWNLSRLDRALECLKNANAANFNALREEFDAITTSEGITTFISQVESQARKGTLPYRHPILNTLATKITLSPIGTAEHVKSIEGWFQWNASSELVARIDDTAKQVALITVGTFYGLDYHKIIFDAPNSLELMDALVDHAACNEERWMLDHLTESSFFADRHLRRIPLQLLSQMELREEHRSILMDVLADDTISDDTWSTIETLSDEYEGSIQELIELATAI
jgi:hypothetical protein